MECVADLSFCAGWFQPSQGHEPGTRLLKAHLAGNVTVICPSIWRYEVLNLLLTAVRRGTLSELQAEDGIDLLNVVGVKIEDHHTNLIEKRLYRLSRQYKLSAYDAAYLELADRLQSPLLTRDRDLLAAAKQRNLSVTIPL